MKLRSPRRCSPCLRWLAALVTCIACSGAQLPASHQGELRVEPPAVGLDGHAGVDLLGRGYLLQGQQVPADFGYYLYLIFQVGASKKDRLGAATAFMELAKAGAQLEDGASPGEIAAFLVPIAATAEPSTPEDLVQHYDAARADIVTSRVAHVGKQLAPVSIVAYPKPIGAGSKLDPAQLLVADACGDAATVREKIKTIHAKLRRGDDDDTTLVMRVLEGFGALGNLVSTGSFNGCS